MTIELNSVVIAGIKNRLRFDRQEQVGSILDAAKRYPYFADNANFAFQSMRGQFHTEGEAYMLREIGITVEWPEDLNELPKLIYKGEEL